MRRTTTNRRREYLAITIGCIHKHTSPNISASALRDWREQRLCTRDFMKSMEFEGKEGNRVSLIERYDTSQTNPTIRRAEMMGVYGVMKISPMLRIMLANL